MLTMPTNHVTRHCCLPAFNGHQNKWVWLSQKWNNSFQIPWVSTKVLNWSGLKFQTFVWCNLSYCHWWWAVSIDCLLSMHVYFISVCNIFRWLVQERRNSIADVSLALTHWYTASLLLVACYLRSWWGWWCDDHVGYNWHASPTWCGWLSNRTEGGGTWHEHNITWERFLH